MEKIRSYEIQLSWWEDPDCPPSPVTVKAKSYFEACEKANEMEIRHEDGDTATVGLGPHHVYIAGERWRAAVIDGKECVRRKDHGGIIWESEKIGSYEESKKDEKMWVPIEEAESALEKELYGSH